MKLGEVYIWETDQVVGGKPRNKIQIYIYSEGGYHHFMFVNTMDWWKDHKLLKENYSAFLKYDSYVAGNSVTAYPVKEFDNMNLEPVGQISKDDLKALRDAIIAAETMPIGQANKVCAALAKAT